MSIAIAGYVLSFTLEQTITLSHGPYILIATNMYVTICLTF